MEDAIKMKKCEPFLVGRPLSRIPERPERCAEALSLTMKSQTVLPLEPSAAATIAGEDLASGDYIALLNQTVDFPSFLWDACGASLSPHELVRLKVIPGNAGRPMRVIAICLPFVYAKTPKGKTATIDTRRTQLVRLDRKCAKVIWKELRRAPKQPQSS
jgi:hypothetical protein